MTCWLLNGLRSIKHEQSSSIYSHNVYYTEFNSGWFGSMSETLIYFDMQTGPSFLSISLFNQIWLGAQWFNAFLRIKRGADAANGRSNIKRSFWDSMPLTARAILNALSDIRIIRMFTSSIRMKYLECINISRIKTVSHYDKWYSMDRMPRAPTSRLCG